MSSGVPVYQDIIASNTFPRHRKPLIERLQKRLDSKLIVYTASPFHPMPSIMTQDIPSFEDLLRSTAGAEKGYLMINSPGGNADVADKIIMMCRQRFQKEFNVIVPDYAKSAASMVALGSDKILMGYLAELGPIDPQLRTAPIPGPSIPARSFLDGLEMIRRNVTQRGDPAQMYFPMLSQISPQVLAMCQSAIDGSRSMARKWLRQYMLKNDPKHAAKVAKWLSEGKRYKSHGRVIDFTEARDVLRLNVEKIDPNSDLWSDVWELYCRSIAFLQRQQRQGAAKLYESDSVSLVLNLQIIGLPQPTPSRPVPSPRMPQPRQPPRPPPAEQPSSTAPEAPPAQEESQPAFQ